MKVLFPISFLVFLTNQITIGQNITGSGTANNVSKFTSTYTIGSSIITDNGTNVGIGTTTPAYKLDVNGSIRGTNTANMDLGAFGTGSTIYIRSSYYNKTSGYLPLCTIT